VGAALAAGTAPKAAPARRYGKSAIGSKFRHIPVPQFELGMRIMFPEAGCEGWSRALTGARERFVTNGRLEMTL